LQDLEAELDNIGVADDDLAYNLTWHDWMNLKNLILVSRAITASASVRDDSRGAHYRSDFPAASALETSAFIRVVMKDGILETSTRTVEFSRVRPGETLLGKDSG